MSPPPRKGSIASSSSSRPHSTPMPVGPSILWAEKETKSAPQALRSIGRCGAHWQASTDTTAPALLPRRMSSATGLTVPIAFESAVKVKSLGASERSFLTFSKSSVPSGSIGTYLTTTPRSAASNCHGTMFEWCSISVDSTMSPAFKNFRPQACATRFKDSVAFRVNINVSGFGAPTNAASFARTASAMFVDSSDKVCTPRWTLALCFS